MKNIIRDSLFLTEKAIESNLLPEILSLMAHPNESVRNKSAGVVCEIVNNNVQVTLHTTLHTNLFNNIQ